MEKQKKEDLLHHISDEDFKRWLESQLRGEETPLPSQPEKATLPFPQRAFSYALWFLGTASVFWLFRWLIRWGSELVVTYSRKPTPLDYYITCALIGLWLLAFIGALGWRLFRNQ